MPIDLNDPLRPSLEKTIISIFEVFKSSVLGYFFYVYAFDNPDVNKSGYECFASPGQDVGFPAAPDGDYTNVTKKFEMWFLFGFAAEMSYLVLGVLGLVHAIAGAGVIFNCKTFGQQVMCLGWLAWLITGIVFRFRHTGEVCSGKYYDPNAVDVEPNVYMWKSGRFMDILIRVFAAVIPTVCLIMCCLGICFRKKIQDHIVN